MATLRCRATTAPSITIQGETIQRGITTKLLGIPFNNKLTWDAHVEELHSKRCTKTLLPSPSSPNRSRQKQRPEGCVTIIRCFMQYAHQLWHTSLSAALLDKMESIQRRPLKTVFTGLSYRAAALQHMHKLTALAQPAARTMPENFLWISCPRITELHDLIPDQIMVPHKLTNNYEEIPSDQS